MRTYDAGQFDIAVIGAGHAGIEAALAAARMVDLGYPQHTRQTELPREQVLVFDWGKLDGQ